MLRRLLHIVSRLMFALAGQGLSRCGQLFKAADYRWNAFGLTLDDSPESSRTLLQLAILLEAFGIDDLGSVDWAMHSRAQLQQDVFALLALDEKQAGYFVEVGVGNGEFLSNTWLLERHFGWTGLLCEPNPEVHHQIRRGRSAVLDERAAWRESGQTVQFLLDENSPGGELSQLLPVNGRDSIQRRGTTLDVTTATLDDILDDAGAGDDIDFLSVDVEGAELEVLEGLSRRGDRIRVACIEHSYDTAKLAAMSKWMAARGLVRVLPHISRWDAWFVRESIVVESRLK